MIAAMWVLLSATWAAHLGTLFLPATFVMDLLMGQAQLTHRLILLFALVPQLILIPWAWRDSALRIAAGRTRTMWRVSFFFTGFVAVTWYLVKRRQFEPL